MRRRKPRKNFTNQRRFETVYCDGEQLRNEETNIESESDDKSDNNEDEEAANTTDDNEKTQQTSTKTPQDPVILADYCEENSDLKNYAMFLDNQKLKFT